MAYRIHPENESPETVLDHDRPMGFYADEIGQDHVAGISGCSELSGLLRWVVMYSCNVRPGDAVLKIDGETDADCYDAGEVVCLPTKYMVLGYGSDIIAAQDAVDYAAGDEDDLIERLDELDASDFARELARILFDD